jgi:hypothetical protein
LTSFKTGSFSRRTLLRGVSIQMQLRTESYYSYVCDMVLQHNKVNHQLNIASRSASPLEFWVCASEQMKTRNNTGSDTYIHISTATPRLHGLNLDFKQRQACLSLTKSKYSRLCYNERSHNEIMLQRTVVPMKSGCYNKQFLSIKSECYNERGGILSADVARACA